MSLLSSYCDCVAAVLLHHIEPKPDRKFTFCLGITEPEKGSYQALNSQPGIFLRDQTNISTKAFLKILSMKLLNSALLHSQTFTKRQWQCLHKSTNFFN